MNIPSPHVRKRARIEIIPLIDVIFFLLATFMMVSLSMIKNKGIPVHLPGASTGAAQDHSNDTVITVASNGTLYFNKETLKIEQLPDRLRQLKTTNPDPKVYINGDEKAFYGAAVGVLDELRKAGITKVSVDTQNKP